MKEEAEVISEELDTITQNKDQNTTESCQEASDEPHEEKNPGIKGSPESIKQPDTTPVVPMRPGEVGEARPCTHKRCRKDRCRFAKKTSPEKLLTKSPETRQVVTETLVEGSTETNQAANETPPDEPEKEILTSDPTITDPLPIASPGRPQRGTKKRKRNSKQLQTELTLNELDLYLDSELKESEPSPNIVTEECSPLKAQKQGKKGKVPKTKKIKKEPLTSLESIEDATEKTTLEHSNSQPANFNSPSPQELNKLQSLKSLIPPERQSRRLRGQAALNLPSRSLIQHLNPSQLNSEVKKLVLADNEKQFVSEVSYDIIPTSPPENTTCEEASQVSRQEVSSSSNGEFSSSDDVPLSLVLPVSSNESSPAVVEKDIFPENEINHTEETVADSVTPAPEENSAPPEERLVAPLILKLKQTAAKPKKGKKRGRPRKGRPPITNEQVLKVDTTNENPIDQIENLQEDCLTEAVATLPEAVATLPSLDDKKTVTQEETTVDNPQTCGKNEKSQENISPEAVEQNKAVTPPSVDANTETVENAETRKATITDKPEITSSDTPTISHKDTLAQSVSQSQVDHSQFSNKSAESPIICCLYNPLCPHSRITIKSEPTGPNSTTELPSKETGNSTQSHETTPKEGEISKKKLKPKKPRKKKKDSKLLAGESATSTETLATGNQSEKSDATQSVKCSSGDIPTTTQEKVDMLSDNSLRANMEFMGEALIEQRICISDGSNDPTKMTTTSIVEIIEELERDNIHATLSSSGETSPNLLDNVQACSKYVSDTMNMCSTNQSSKPNADHEPQPQTLGVGTLPSKVPLTGFESEIKKQLEHKLSQQQKSNAHGMANQTLNHQAPQHMGQSPGGFSSYSQSGAQHHHQNYMQGSSFQGNGMRYPPPSAKIPPGYAVNQQTTSQPSSFHPFNPQAAGTPRNFPYQMPGVPHTTGSHANLPQTISSSYMPSMSSYPYNRAQSSYSSSYPHYPPNRTVNDSLNSLIQQRPPFHNMTNNVSENTSSMPISNAGSMNSSMGNMLQQPQSRMLSCSSSSVQRPTQGGLTSNTYSSGVNTPQNLSTWTSHSNGATMRTNVQTLTSNASSKDSSCISTVNSSSSGALNMSLVPPRSSTSVAASVASAETQLNSANTHATSANTSLQMSMQSITNSGLKVPTQSVMNFGPNVLIPSNANTAPQMTQSITQQPGSGLSANNMVSSGSNAIPHGISSSMAAIQPVSTSIQQASSLASTVSPVSSMVQSVSTVTTTASVSAGQPSVQSTTLTPSSGPTIPLMPKIEMAAPPKGMDLLDRLRNNMTEEMAYCSCPGGELMFHCEIINLTFCRVNKSQGPGL